jgi:catechol 2,3-dioxygenase-like lactoylglutathione lyase family enzyme
MAKRTKENKVMVKGLNQIWTVNVWVSDMKRSIEFYTQKLGFKVALLDEKNKWVELDLPGGFTKIALREPTTALGESYYKYMTQMIGTSTGIAFETYDIKAQGDALGRHHDDLR